MIPVTVQLFDIRLYCLPLESELYRTFKISSMRSLMICGLIRRSVITDAGTGEDINNRGYYYVPDRECASRGDIPTRTSRAGAPISFRKLPA